MGEEPRFPFTCLELTELLGSGRQTGGELAVVWRPLDRMSYCASLCICSPSREAVQGLEGTPTPT